ncbi:MAG: SGNH/GDSL hydrolase family protein [Planctomycetota bacterium]
MPFARCLLVALIAFPLSGGIAAGQTALKSAKSKDQPSPAIGNIDPEMADGKPADDGLAWFDVTTWGVEGRILPEQNRLRWFDRLPAAAEQTVTKNVWNLSRHSAGMMVRFKTDASAIHVHYKLLNAKLAMPHMPATGVSGIDLYARDNEGRWRWVQVTRPSSQEIKAKLVDGLSQGIREFAAYLPLYNGVESLSIGVATDRQFETLAPRKKPIVFYGTSITHGACASRPGMVHTAILGRRFDHPVVNLGFSGNGRMHAEVGDYLTQIDAAAYVIDCLPNMNAGMVKERCIPLVKQLRAAKPKTPIILVEDRRNTNSWILPARDAHHTANHNALSQAYESLRQQSVSQLYYIPGDSLYGDDGEGATDGSHASDLGFMRQADVFAPILKSALNR